tara:strand:+ start:87 stop:755 length:669 start_codon:yes stop_codon:yes gene_type:complete
MKNKEILEKLSVKSVTKQKVHRTTKEVFGLLKNCCANIASELNKESKLIDNNVSISLIENGDYEFKLQFSGDVLIFNMHSNTFTFDEKHEIWNNPKIKEDSLNAYCGVINVYNFLNDSFKHNRLNDLGFLVSRIFINKDKNFFVESKARLTDEVSNFNNEKINDAFLSDIVSQLILFSIDFELLTPSFDDVQVVSLHEMIKINNEMKLKTSKKLGYKFSNEK